MTSSIQALDTLYTLICWRRNVIRQRGADGELRGAALKAERAKLDAAAEHLRKITKHRDAIDSLLAKIEEQSNNSPLP